jgi:CYTH domain-containing protein
MTIRRRFLLAPSFARLIQRERGGLRQVEGYFPEQRDRTSWVRMEGSRGLLILRSTGPDGDVEEETEVPVGHVHALLDVCSGEVDYTRTALPISGHHTLIDQIVRPRALHLVTVEFDTEVESQAFEPLEWFGPEVTGDPRYTHHSIALKGLAVVPEITLSDAALNSLIDTLEGRFPDQARMTTNRPKARQVPVTKATAQSGDQAITVDLADIEQAMMREMDRVLQKGEPE